MKYIFNKEAHKLCQHIDSRFSFCVEQEVVDKTDLIVPDCTPGLMYISKGSFQRSSAWGQRTLEAGHVYLFGQKTHSVEYIFNQPGVEAIGFKLFPYAIYSMFGIAGDEITDKIISLQDIGRSDEFRDLLLKGNTKEALRPAKQFPKILMAILFEIHKLKGLVNINELINAFNVSYKKLERLFKLYIGITPKLYTRITRFNHSLKVGTHRKFNLTDVAYECGYYDQNHFIKEIKRFCDVPPSRLMNLDNSPLQIDHLNYLLERKF